jgi:hypothetical protein
MAIIWNPYFRYMPGICLVYTIYVDVLHIHGIYKVYPWVCHVYPSDWIYMVYPWIYHVYPPGIYMVYPLIYMVYHLMYTHGIFVVYHGISMDIPSFLKPDFAACQCCWSHSMRTRVCGWSRVFIPRATMPIVLGEKAAHKRLNPAAANLPLCHLQRRWRRRRRSFSFLLWATTWILVKDGALGAFRAGDQYVEQLRWLPVLKIA